MPLDNGQWRDTTPEDLQNFRDELGGMVEVPVTPEISSRIEKALSRTKRQKGLGLDVMIDGNRRLYPELERLMGQSSGIVDIIVPVYNAWHIARQCLDAVDRCTRWPHRVIVVDDASDDYTAGAIDDHHSEYVRNARNRGFAASVNRGIRYGEGRYVCLLNSDVLVTPNWLTKMVMALEADDRHAIVCPATNNTAIVEIPMSPGASYLQMNAALEAFAQRRRPEIMPTGFCFMFRRSLLDEVGYFDEAYRFAGEESDLWWRTLTARTPRYKAVMADDVYVFHERASSSSALGKEADATLRRQAIWRFNSLHPEWVRWRDAYDLRAALGTLREPVPAAFIRSVPHRYRVCWLVHDARHSGAMQYIADVVNELIDRGVDAKVAVLLRSPEQPQEWLGAMRCAPVYFETVQLLMEEWPERVFPDGLVLAGTAELSPVVSALVDASGGRIRGCLHAQSFEPAMTDDDAIRTHFEALYRLLPDVISCSHWIAEEIAKVGPQPFAVVHPGVDRTLFYPRDRSAGDERPTVAIPMTANPDAPWRGRDRGLQLILELERQADERGIDLRILVYGVESLPIQSRAVCLGTIPQTRLAQVLGTEVDMLVDPSYVHSYGMPALEAAACRVHVFSWANRGIDETVGVPSDVTPERMAEFVLSTEPGRYFCTDEVLDRHDRSRSVSTFIERIEDHFRLNRPCRRICIVVPHLRKWGGPTTMLEIGKQLAARGHKVEIVTAYPEVSPAIDAECDLPIRLAPRSLPEADVYIVNSDNPRAPEVAAQPARRIMLKLSHNPRFKQLEEQGLQLPWDAVVTSTEWLAEACRKPWDGWRHAPVEATAIGWWHYEHRRFRCAPEDRAYGDGTDEPIVVGTLVHSHPLKGTQRALEVMAGLQANTDWKWRFIGVGELAPQAVRTHLPGFEYRANLSRDELAATMREVDIWLSCSQSEGLGRMTLEAMSAGCAVVALEIGGEYLPGVLYVSDSELASGVVISNAPHHRRDGFPAAEQASDPTACIDALECVIEETFK